MVTSMLESLRLMSTKLFVGGLSWGTDDQSLRDAFAHFGEVVDAPKVIVDESAAIKEMDGQLFIASIGSSMVGNNILVTGGAGYIGSHTVLQLLRGGYNTVVIDNLDNSSLNRVKDLAGYNWKYLTFHQVDLLDKPALEKVFSESKFDAVIHFAGQKAGECVAENLIKTITLLVVMAAHGCKKLVVSTFATPKEVPCTEESPLSEMSHYGPIQVFTEYICRDFLRGDPEWRIIMLRYFNPVGAHPSGRFGEYPYHILIMPYLQQVADYTTKDGASVRDYLQVVDLADGHICALQKLDDTEIGCEVYNLTAKGTTVMEMVGASEKASGMKNPLVRGPGDPIEVDGVSEKSVVSGIQCTDLPIEVSENSEGALHKLSAYPLKQTELEDLDLMESVVDIQESHVLFQEPHGTEVKEKLLGANL